MTFVIQAHAGNCFNIKYDREIPVHFFFSYAQEGGSEIPMAYMMPVEMYNGAGTAFYSDDLGRGTFYACWYLAAAALLANPPAAPPDPGAPPAISHEDALMLLRLYEEEMLTAEQVSRARQRAREIAGIFDTQIAGILRQP